MIRCAWFSWGRHESCQNTYGGVIKLQEKPAEHYVVEYIPCEAEYDDDKVTYYVIKDDGKKTKYTPAYGDAPVEYVIKSDDGSTKPYTGPVEVVTSSYTPGGFIEHVKVTRIGFKSLQIKVVLKCVQCHCSVVLYGCGKHP